MGKLELKLCTVREKIFCTGPTRAAKAGKISFTGTTSLTNQPRKDPFHFTAVSTASRGHPSQVSLASIPLFPIVFIEPL
jgi:hypothetical protein